MANILLVDDDPWVRKIFLQFLEMAGHTVVEADNGKDGIKLFRKKPADLVITDMVMPFKDGLEMIMDLKNDYPNVRVIAISGGGAIEPERYLTLAKTIGATKTLQKPLSKAELLAAVDKALAE